MVNNASAIDLSPTDEIAMKKYDLMQDINCRGSYLLARTCLPAVHESTVAERNPHILTLSPPIDTNPRWAGAHLGYTIAKYGMSLTALGLAHELRPAGIAVNSLWPRTTIASAAVENVLAATRCSPAHALPRSAPTPPIRCSPPPAAETSRNFFLDEDVLAAAGVPDFRQVPCRAPAAATSSSTSSWTPDSATCRSRPLSALCAGRVSR
ncbi:SDR family oxidoreductase [Nocardia sp. NPDC059246]|uniref:SDR family oxidoreductase n=1 Tax=unclassified Nocardia TaxID=2637762 RepID=UPI0036BD42C9